MSIRKRSFVPAIAIAALAVGLFITATAQSQQVAAPALRVGTYNPQQAFNQHPDTPALMQQLQQMQQQMQQAQQQGDRDAMGQLQQQMQQQQQQAIESFQTELRDTAVDVATENQVDVVAVQIIHTADDVQVQDLTPLIVDAFKQQPAN